MAAVKSVKIDGESIHVFNSALYILESGIGKTLVLDMIVSEVAIRKYKKEETLIIEIELEDGRIIHSIMYVKTLPGGLPQLNLSCEVEDIQEFGEIEVVNENDSWFPDIEKGITLEDIRKVEMPEEDITLKIKLPINQVDWLKSQKKRQLNQLVRDFIYEYWEKNGLK